MEPLVKSTRVRMPRCAIAGIEATIAQTAQTFPRHSHDRFGIGVMASGGQRSASGRGPVEARANDVITVNPGEVHDGSPLDEHGRTWRMFYFEPALLGSALAELNGSASQSFELTAPVARDPLLKARFEQLFALAVHVDAKAGAPNPLACEEALFALIEHVGRHHTTQATPAHRDIDALVTRARARIDDEPAAALTLAELAAEAGMSRFQLLRAFARETGLPPHAYQLQQRVRLARRLIASRIEPGLGLANVAAAAGFADQSHMTRAFVRLFGVTPAAYASAVR
ncbi:AraC family transcriptional regulator [Paraburkholderia flava]|uniref:AraC family transcriptional regulator n=1 Tax=Paraburkholderia flava TaxID=2547393 RepID=UPI00105D5317|nr:AraC family transcriptional regulator [Paraburkholderia flava]